MHRFLIALAIVVGVLTLSAVGYMVYRARPSQPPAAAPMADDTATVGAPAKPAARAPRTRVAQNTRVADESAPDMAASDSSAVKPTVAVTKSLDVASFLDGLTPEEEKALQAAMISRFMQKRIQDRRYQLPATGKMSRLDRVDPKLALSAAQQTQLDSVMQGLKPQMDTAFKDVWAQQDQLRGQIAQVFSGGADREQARQQIEPLRQQMEALNTQIQPQQDAFNQQVMAAMTPYLTPDQVQAINNMPADTGRGFGFGGPGGNGGPPGLGVQGGGGGRRGGGGGQPSGGGGAP